MLIDDPNWLLNLIMPYVPFALMAFGVVEQIGKWGTPKKQGRGAKEAW
jgi:hypothetical protein